MLDADLALLYGVETKVLNQAVKRNIERFPADFMFQLTVEETSNLRSQFVTSSLGYGGQRYLPYVFTEHGVAMLSAILKSKQAVEMSIFIVRAFIKMRELLSTQKGVAYKIDKIVDVLESHDEQISQIQETLDQMRDEPVEPKGKIGYKAD
ncbi:MAG: ORF6N domain-containing protein [Candidatus Pacebacteria bacterium]|nr:ORF6N domain-containing protein [Candidatus Paceibacterota bacterium]